MQINFFVEADEESLMEQSFVTNHPQIQTITWHEPHCWPVFSFNNSCPKSFGFCFFPPTTTNPFLTYIIAFLPHLLSFYFLLKSLLRGLYYAFVRDPLTQWCSMMTKVVWVFILTSLAWNEISQKPEGGGGRLTVDYLAQKTYIMHCNLILSHPLHKSNLCKARMIALGQHFGIAISPIADL